MTFVSRSLRGGLCLATVLALLPSFVAQAQVVDTTPSRKTLEEAAGDNCEGVSGVLRRCAQQAKDADAKAAAQRSDDPLTRSRAVTKEGFDRQDRRARDDALNGGSTDGGATGTGDAQKLGGVSVTGKSDAELTPEEILQRNLAPPPAKSATTVKYGADGARYECIESCVGPACCVPLRNLPNPARDSNSIGR